MLYEGHWHSDPQEHEGCSAVWPMPDALNINTQNRGRLGAAAINRCNHSSIQGYMQKQTSKLVDLSHLQWFSCVCKVRLWYLCPWLLFWIHTVILDEQMMRRKERKRNRKGKDKGTILSVCPHHGIMDSCLIWLAPETGHMHIMLWILLLIH